MTERYYVEFLFHGGIRSIEVEVGTRNPHVVVPPERAFGFRFFSMYERGRERVSESKYDESGVYYPSAKILTQHDVAREMGEDAELLRSMKSKGWERVVRTRDNHFRELEAGDEVL